MEELYKYKQVEDLAALLEGEGVCIIQLLVRIITKLFVFQTIVPFTPPRVIFINHMVWEQIEVVVVEKKLVMEVETSMQLEEQDQIYTLRRLLVLTNNSVQFLGKKSYWNMVLSLLNSQRSKLKKSLLKQIRKGLEITMVFVQKLQQLLSRTFLLTLVAYSRGTGFPRIGGKFSIFPKTREFPVSSPFLFPVPVFLCSPLWGIYTPNFGVPVKSQRNVLVQRSDRSFRRKIQWYEAQNVQFLFSVYCYNILTAVQTTKNQLLIAIYISLSPRGNKISKSEVPDRPFPENMIGGTGL